MPKIKNFILKTPPTNKRSANNWDVSGLVQQTTGTFQPQRRPGRGDDNLTSDELERRNDLGHSKEGLGIRPENQQQTSNKVATQPATKWQQTSNKVATNQQQENPQSKESDNTTSNTTSNKVATKWQQTSNKVTTSERLNFSSLVGLQRSLLQLMHRQCLERRERSTGPMALEHLSHSVNTTKRAVKVTLQRLQMKGFLKPINFKNGRGGWTEYEIPDDVFQDVLRTESSNKLATKWQQTSNKVPTQLATQPATSLSSSSSSLYNNKTTTTGGTEPSAPAIETTNPPPTDPKWLALDITGLTEIGFTQTHLTQVARDGKLTSEIVQDSIRHFAFDLRTNNKAKELRGPALNYFMGILRKGFPYAAPENYSSPEAEAMKTYLESKKADQERRKTLEEALYELEFTNWTQSLSEEEKLNLAPPSGFGGERGQQAKLSVHFRKNVWPELRNTLNSRQLLKMKEAPHV